MTTKVMEGHKEGTTFKVNKITGFLERLRDLLTFRSFDLITTLTYVLMHNFCPCFISF